MVRLLRLAGTCLKGRLADFADSVCCCKRGGGCTESCTESSERKTCGDLEKNGRK